MVPTPAPPPPMAARSFISVVRATVQPWLTSPSRWSSGTRTSLKNTSLNDAPPVIWRSGRTSTPGACMSTTKPVRPLCLGASGSVRQMISPMSLYCAPDVHTFWPVTSHSSPSRIALVWRPARSEPAPGSLNSWQPDDVAPVHLAEVGVLHLVGGVGEDRRRHHAEADAEGRLRRGGELGLDRLVDPLVRVGELAPAVLGRPGDPPEAGVEELLAPGLGRSPPRPSPPPGSSPRARPRLSEPCAPTGDLGLTALGVGLEEGQRFGAELVLGDHGSGAYPARATLRP